MSEITRAEFATQQSWMLRAIATPADHALRAQAPQFLRSTATLVAEARLAIYQRSYRARLLEAFHAIFPALLHAIGAEALDTFALDFLAHNAPKSRSVGRIADGFAEYLNATRPPVTDGEPAGWEDFVLDLARFELALLQVSEARGLEEAATLPAIDMRELSESDLLDARPAPAPCLRLLACQFPVHRYWHAVRDGGEPEQPASARVWLALTRVDYRLNPRELAQVQWEMLVRFGGTRRVGDVLDDVLTLGLRPAPDKTLARIWLANFLAQGLLMFDATE